MLEAFEMRGVRSIQEENQQEVFLIFSSIYGGFRFFGRRRARKVVQNVDGLCL